MAIEKINLTFRKLYAKLAIFAAVMNGYRERHQSKVLLGVIVGFIVVLWVTARASVQVGVSIINPGDLVKSLVSGGAMCIIVFYIITGIPTLAKDFIDFCGSFYYKAPQKNEEYILSLVGDIKVISSHEKGVNFVHLGCSCKRCADGEGWYAPAGQFAIAARKN